MTVTEAARIAAVLAEDPSTATGAALAGLAMPVSLEAIVLADLFDLQMARAVKRPEPYRRPWIARRKPSRRIGQGTRLTPADFHARWAELTDPQRRRTYTTTDGRSRQATAAQIAYWTRGRRRQEETARG